MSSFHDKLGRTRPVPPVPRVDHLRSQSAGRLSATNLPVSTTMIEQLRSAGDQLCAALDNYSHIYSTIRNHHTQGRAPYVYEFPPDLTRQLDAELARISSHEQQLKQVKASISSARNYSPGLSPIGSLAPEILTRIFRLVISQPCGTLPLSYSSKMYFPGYPEDLAQVCALWRRTVISSQPLWRHIDILAYKPGYNRAVARAEAYVERAGNHPIELRVVENQCWHFEDGDYSDLYDLVSRITSRVETLEFVIGRLNAVHLAVFNIFWSNQHSRLSKLVLRSEDQFPVYVRPGHFAYHGWDEETDDLELNILRSQIDKARDRLTTLHLHGVFPWLSWESTVYTGLVDLRLLPNGPSSDIQGATLVKILHASPGLRIFHFGLSMLNLTPLTEEVTPVCLENLQIVKQFTFVEDGASLYLSYVLRLLAPGEKPLRLWLGYRTQRDVFTTELERFFARSRVAKLYTRGYFPPISTLLCHAVHLEHVILHDSESHDQMQLHPVEEPALLPNLRSIHVTNSRLLECHLRLLTKCCPTGTMLHASTVIHNDNGAEFSAEEVLEVFPTVKTSPHSLPPSEDPTIDWDILD